MVAVLVRSRVHPSDHTAGLSQIHIPSKVARFAASGCQILLWTSALADGLF